MESRTKPSREPSQKPNDVESRRRLTGCRILIVEDVGMVAMALKSMLEDLGCVVVGMAARLPEAEKLARQETLDGVLLDLNLGGQYAFPVADILRKRDIPFIIMSGYDAGQLRPDLASVPQMQKPLEREPLLAMILMKFCAGRQGDESAPLVSPRSPSSVAKANQKAPTKTRGEIEAAVCQGMCRFEQEYMGRGPRDVHAHLIGDLLVVRLQGVLNAAELQLAEISSVERGRDLIKQVRSVLIETARKQVDSMIQVITSVKVISMHHDISTVTGEKIVIFTLNEAPAYREVKK